MTLDARPAPPSSVQPTATSSVLGRWLLHPIAGALLIGILTTGLFHLVVAFEARSYWTTHVVWDEGYYISIAKAGYELPEGDFRTSNRLPFSPGYPLVLRGLWKLTGIQPAYWRAPLGVLLFLISAVLLPWVLSAISSDRKKNLRTLLVFSLWPGSIYFRTGYAEALYLPLLLGSMGFILRRKWFFAAVLAGAAWFTRTPAIVLVGTLGFAIVLDALRRPTLMRALRRAWMTLSWTMPIAALGMLGYMAMVHAAVGEWMAFRKAYIAWGPVDIASRRNLELKTAVEAFWFFTDRPTLKLAVLSFLATPIVILLQRRHMGPVQVAFSLGAWCFFLSQDWLLAPYWDMVRWMAVVFPFHFAIVGMLDGLRGRARKIGYAAWITASAVGFVWFARLFLNREWAS